MARLHESAKGAGDWFDVIPLSSSRVALAVGHMSTTPVATPRGGSTGQWTTESTVPIPL